MQSSVARPELLRGHAKRGSPGRFSLPVYYSNRRPTVRTAMCIILLLRIYISGGGRAAGRERIFNDLWGDADPCCRGLG